MTQPGASCILRVGVCGFTSSGTASCVMKLRVLSRTDQFHPYLPTWRNDVLWEGNRKRLESEEELLMSYKNSTQSGLTDGRHNRHNED